MHQVTTSLTTSDNDWQTVVVSANFPFFRIREEPITKDHKENLNLTEDFEEGQLN